MAMQTYMLGQFPNSKALLQAAANKIAEVLGWEIENLAEDDFFIYTANIPVGFEIKGGSSFSAAVRSKDGRTVPAQATTTSFSSSNYYELYILKKASGTIALGMSTTLESFMLSMVITQLETGEYVGIGAYNSASMFLFENMTTQSLPGAIAQTNTQYCISMFKMVNWIKGGLFRDLYKIYTSPSSRIVDLIYLNGKFYRPISSANYTYFLVPEN